MAPDGSSTLRFNLSTMKKIAHRAGEWRQPPHFRAKMSEALERQIRRKWGDRALRLAAPDGAAQQLVAYDRHAVVGVAAGEHRLLIAIVIATAVEVAVPVVAAPLEAGRRRRGAARVGARLERSVVVVVVGIVVGEDGHARLMQTAGG